MPESSRSVQLWLFTGMERQESARGLISYHARSANRPAFCQPQSSPHSWCRGSRPPNGRKAFSPWLTNSKNETWIEEKENQGRTDRDGKWRREGKGREGPHHGAGTSPNSESCVASNQFQSSTFEVWWKRRNWVTEWKIYSRRRDNDWWRCGDWPGIFVCMGVPPRAGSVLCILIGWPRDYARSLVH